jgi:DNA primase
MARIKDTSLREVLDRVEMVDVVQARTQLRRSGARWTGRCPFHEEKTPSFSVDPVKKVYYCFGCHAGGDAIRFVRETENLDFVQAIEVLAERFGVTLEYEDAAPGDDQRRARDRRLYDLLDTAAGFYERYLWETPSGAAARAYLAGRGLEEAVCREFRLGLAPAGAGTLAGKAREKGFAPDELAAVGLVNRGGKDWFRARLMFPLADARGRIVGFGARRMREDDPLQAKYVNSPEGDLFHKQDLLYGLDLARAAIAKQARAIVVEGYTDVLALRQAGQEPVVASMGTALTDRQVSELKRLAPRVFLCFDADAAGEAATLRGMELAFRQGLDVRIVPLPAGRDPAEVAGEFETLLAAAENYLPYHVKLLDRRTPDRQAFLVAARAFLAGHPSSLQRREAERYLTDRLDLPKGMQDELAATAAPGAAPSPRMRRVLDAGERLERTALAGVVAHPSLGRVLAELSPLHFDTELHRCMRAELLEPGAADEELSALRGELEAQAVAEAIDAPTAEQALLRLRERRLRRELDGSRPELAAELAQQLSRIRAAIEELSWVESAGRVPR